MIDLVGFRNIVSRRRAPYGLAFATALGMVSLALVAKVWTYKVLQHGTTEHARSFRRLRGPQQITKTSRPYPFRYGAEGE
jgi:hypothetical protein